MPFLFLNIRESNLQAYYSSMVIHCLTSVTDNVLRYILCDFLYTPGSNKGQYISYTVTLNLFDASQCSLL